MSDPRCKLVAVTDELEISPERAKLNQEFARELGLPYIEDLDEALSIDEVDIVSICAEHERRGRVAAKCAKAGKHLYLDKPMTCSVQDADAVVEAVRSAGVKSQVYSFVHTSWAKRAKDILQSGELGDLLSIHCDVMFAKGYTGTASIKPERIQDPYPSRFTFIDSKRELRATGVYSVGLIRWLTGLEAESVFCVTQNYFFAEHQHNDVEDFGILAINLQNGIHATVSAGRIGYMSHPSSGPMKIYLVGTKGLVAVDAYKPRVEIYNGEIWTPPEINPDDPMGFWVSTYKNNRPKSSWVQLHEVSGSNDVKYFIDCIESGVESDVSAIDGAAQVEILMAGYVSAAKGKVVHLPLPR